MKLWTGLAGAFINLICLIGLAVFWQISALRQFSAQISAELRKELEHYRIIMLAPRLSPPSPAVRRKPRGAVAKPGLEPLAVANPRILRALDPALTDFIAENPEIESVVTREIVRDVDSKVLDVRSLLEKSSMQVSFGLDEAGHIRWRRVDKSSRVPSIDHLAMELVQLLEKYSVLEVIEGIDHVVASIRIDQQIEISLEGTASPQAHIDAIRGRIEAGLVVWRLLLPVDEAISFLQDVNVVTQENRIRISKIYDKDSIVKLLKQYYQPEPAK